MDLDHGVMTPMRHTTSPAQPRRRGATGNAPVRPRGAHYGTPDAKIRPFGRHSRNVTAHSKEIAAGGSRFFCKSFLGKSSRPIFCDFRRPLAPIDALCAKSFVTIGILAENYSIPACAQHIFACIASSTRTASNCASARSSYDERSATRPCPRPDQRRNRTFKKLLRRQELKSYEADPTARRS